MTTHRLTATDLADRAGFKSVRAARERAKALGLGLEYGGRIGYRYSEADVERLIESLQTRPNEESA